MTEYLSDEEFDFQPNTKDGWQAMYERCRPDQPDALARSQYDDLDDLARMRYNEMRHIWHANLGPFVTDSMEGAISVMDQVVQANRQTGEKVRTSIALDAEAGLGKTTLAFAYGRRFHRRQLETYGPKTSRGNERIPVAYIPLTGKMTMRSLNDALCRFYALPTFGRGNAKDLGRQAAMAVRECQTKLIIVDDIHFLDLRTRDGAEVSNQLKALASEFQATFLFVGVGMQERGLFREGRSHEALEYAQTARRWTRVTLRPFDLRTQVGRQQWKKLLKAIERDLVLVEKEAGMLSEKLNRYLFVRSSGRFASLASLISRGCVEAIRTGEEKLTEQVMDRVVNDEASESQRSKINGLRHLRTAT